MKVNKYLLGLMGAGISLAALTQSCVSDAPFAGGDGEGTLRMQLVVNSDLTRASIENEEDLRAKCVVYISGQNGLLYQYKGISEVPEAIRLKSGSYVAEAWTGDSVTASFDKKFFRGYQPFAISEDNNTSIVLNCKIANVVVSVDHTTVLPELMKDWKITVSNSRGELVFDADNMESAKGYFMMPNADIAKDDEGNYLKDENDPGFTYYTNLNYKIEGTTAEGKHFEKSGPICPEGSKGNLVQHAHEYRLRLVYNPQYEEVGGSFVTIEVRDEEVLIQDEIGIYSKPAIKGATFDITHQLQGEAKGFGEQIIKVSAFKTIEQLILKSEDYEAFGIDAHGVDLISAIPAVQDQLKEKGLTWDSRHDDDRNLTTSYLTFSKSYLNSLPERPEEYVLNIYVRDGYGRENTVDFRIAVGEEAKKEDDPVTINDVDPNDLMAVLTSRATLSGTIVNADAENPGIQYRKAGGNDSWQFVPVNLTRAAGSFSVMLTDLEPSTRYEYRAVAGDFTVAQSHYFTTEGKFEIPNASMENWSTLSSNNKIWIPASGGTRYFWDTGNHGAVIANVVLTQASTSMKHSGTYGAELHTLKATVLGIGKLAAGNLFIGEFVKTSGTNGVIDFGKPYDSSHPDALKLWVNYRPAPVSEAKGHLSKGENDHGQIYVAFTTDIIRVDTGNTSTLFNKDDARVLAYGDVTFKDNYGDEGTLKEVVINIDWKDSAKTTRPQYMIVVCSASKYGDYFEGGAGSLMYVDDFELVY